LKRNKKYFRCFTGGEPPVKQRKYKYYFKWQREKKSSQGKYICITIIVRITR